MAGLNPLYPAPDKWRPGDNLLDNWYFVGGGSRLGWGHFPINQRGLTEYTEAGYGIDRWRKNNLNGSVKTAVNGLEVVGNTGGNVLLQYIEHTQIPDGAQITYSLLFDNELISGTTTWDGIYKIVVSENNNQEKIRLAISPQDAYAQIVAYNTIPSTFIAAMLEPGPEQHLAHKEGGKWVLNRVPDFREELAKCQAYQRFGPMFALHYASDATNYYVILHTNTKMAKKPVIIGAPQARAVSNNKVKADASIRVVAVDDLDVRLAVTNVTEPCYIYFQPGTGLDANP